MTVLHEIVLGVVLGKSNHEKDTIPDLQRAHKSVKRPVLPTLTELTSLCCDKGDNGVVTKCHGNPEIGSNGGFPEGKS